MRRLRLWAEVVALLIRILGSSCLSFGVLFLGLSSYAWWGSATSPLGLLFWPGIWLVVAWVVCRFTALGIARGVHVLRGRHFVRQMR
jgi:hypothetical protein